MASINIVLTLLPDHEDPDRTGDIADDSEGRLRRVLEEFGTVTAITDAD